MPIAAYRPTTDVPDTATSPTLTTEVAWGNDPLDTVVTWTDISTYVRAWNTSRGRSFEFDRIEAGTGELVLSNRDMRFNPDNTSGAYYPNVKPTRRTRMKALWRGVTYPIIQAFTEGFPQVFPAYGADATVQQRITDWFMPLNMLKFSGASTTLAADITTAPAAGTSETITVASTVLPLPQAFPFTIQVGSSPDIERMEVTASPASGSWTVTRGADDTTPITFTSGTTVRSTAVRFAEELSGTRIRNCLDMLGVSAPDRDIDDGNTTIAESDDLSGQSILEHLLLIAECENGRLFAAADGTLTFRERHWQFTEELTERATFGPGGSEIQYLAATGNTLAHDDSKLFNRVKITIADGTVIESSDQDSIDAHFARTLEKTWPLASAVEAQDAADWMLSRLKQARVRLPAITVNPEYDLDVWATMLAVDIGQRYRFKLTPLAGTSIDTDVIVERVAHQGSPGVWQIQLELSEADPAYWRVGVSGASEIGETTVPAY